MIEFLVNNLFSSIISGTVAFVAILAFLKVFKPNDPRFRFFLFFAPLLKSLLTLTDAPSIIPEWWPPYGIIIRLPDPLGLIPGHVPEFRHIAYTRLGVLLLALFFIISFLILLMRWAHLFIFRRRLANGPELKEENAPRLIARARHLAKRLGTKVPRMVLADSAYCVPFTVGVVRPTIVLSEEFLKAFDGAKLDAIIAHEMAHTKRLDPMTRWLAVILRDVQAFNPAVRAAVHYMELEREIICDLWADRVLSCAPSFVADVILDVGLFNRRRLSGMSPSRILSHFQAEPVILNALGIRFQPVVRRIQILRSGSEVLESPGRLMRLFASLYFLTVVWVQVGVFFKVAGFYFMLR